MIKKQYLTDSSRDPALPAMSAIDHPDPQHVPVEAPDGKTTRHDRAGRWTRSRRRTALFLLIVLILVPVALTVSGNMDLLAKSIFFRFTNNQPLISAAEITPARPRPAPAFADSFLDSFDHPDKLFRPYFGTPLDDLPTTTEASRLIPPFRQLLDLFIQRQSQDDNFTIRVYDKRSFETMELFTLDEARGDYERTGSVDWRAVDKLRREATAVLVDKYEQRGIPREYIGARWGRRDQVLEARLREAPTLSYEIRLARYLGLSLLATEIGTVETFNDDRLVSSVGARGRYQMMPYLLRQHGIEHYQLQTAYGKRVDVTEEWHPLLTMESAFRILRAYINAVGHEVPGLSAYHTGPGNLYKIFQLFLTEQRDLLSTRTTVMDAYMWAVTEGYEKVSSETSFKAYSQGYVPSGYGALRAVEDLPIDTMQTMLAERVQLKPGKEVYLSDLVQLLDKHGPLLYWGPHTINRSTYERFRALNPHIKLPFGDPEGGVPRDGDVRLVAAARQTPVRFFLPLNASDVLARNGHALFDEAASFRFDHQTYRLPPDAQTDADRAYRDLVADIGRFGFTLVNRGRLDALATQFERLAAADPSHYRRTQLAIIRMHQQLWNFEGWEHLAETTRAATGGLRMPIRPPDKLGELKGLPPVPGARQ